MNNLPFGKVQEFGATATTAYTANNPLTVLTGSVSITAGRLYLVFGMLAVQASASGTANALYVTVTGSITRTLWYDTTAIGTNLCTGVSGWTYITASDLSVTSGTSTKTFNLLWKSGAGGSLNTDPDNYVAAGSFQQRLMIADIGST